MDLGNAVLQLWPGGPTATTSLVCLHRVADWLHMKNNLFQHISDFTQTHRTEVQRNTYLGGGKGGYSGEVKIYTCRFPVIQRMTGTEVQRCSLGLQQVIETGIGAEIGANRLGRGVGISNYPGVDSFSVV